MSGQPPFDDEAIHDDAVEYLYQLYHKNLPPLAADATVSTSSWEPDSESVDANRSNDTAGKTYRRADTVQLAATERTAFLDGLRRRASYVDPTDRRPITDTELATLLTYSYGKISGDNDAGSPRPVPSAGAIYPLELYPIVLDSPDIDPGLYHYNVGDNCLDRLRQREYTDWVQDNWTWIGDEDAVTAVIVITAIPSRAAERYGEMAYLFAGIEAGSVIQNLQLVAADLGIGSRPHNGVRYGVLRNELGLRNDEFLLSTVVFGGSRTEESG